MIRNLKFDDRGLLPTTVQDTRSHQILVQDFMNAESLALTVQSGTVWFYSASRNEVWCSRSSFGQVHRVVDIAPDPEGTGLRIQVEVGDPAVDESKSPDARRARSLSAVPPTRSGVSDP
ncbi:MAG TPA: phosphoribosyl-AMP cyclohydrolase, partial [Acidobacteriota bacterium]|nr:phosphoribosyl-AMP cyclohydrolase [Acidobacteriota bacterium]